METTGLALIPLLDSAAMEIRRLMKFLLQAQLLCAVQLQLLP